VLYVQTDVCYIAWGLHGCVLRISSCVSPRKRICAEVAEELTPESRSEANEISFLTSLGAVIQFTLPSMTASVKVDFTRTLPYNMRL
jgi:hypothetical protein